MLSIRSLFKRKNNSGSHFRITRLEETDSTNAYIHRMLSAPQQGEAKPDAEQARYWVVTTEFQSSGRGQGTNTWESEKGKNLLFIAGGIGLAPSSGMDSGHQPVHSLGSHRLGHT